MTPTGEDVRAEDRDLWEFLRAIEDGPARLWHHDSPLYQRLALLQDRYDPSGHNGGSDG